MQVGTAAILCTETRRLSSSCGTGVVGVMIQRLDDGVVTESKLLTLVAVTRQVMPGVSLDHIHNTARGTLIGENGAVRAQAKVEAGGDTVVGVSEYVQLV